MTCLCILDYNIVHQFHVGGIVSVLLMCLWVGCLILTLHNERSWAVNEIAEIQNANLYYFTWATTLNTGMLSSSYIRAFMKERLHMKRKGLMVSLFFLFYSISIINVSLIAQLALFILRSDQVVLWLAVVKICFVMFGSCVDILLSIRDRCASAEHGDETDIFCKRTEAGAIFGFLGMVIGCLAALYRFFVPSPPIKGLIGESIISTILAVIFALSLAMVTGIGGPGQEVGDLYYGSWLAFFAALGVAVSLYTEVLKKQSKDTVLVSSELSVNLWPNLSTPYSIWAIEEDQELRETATIT